MLKLGATLFIISALMAAALAGVYLMTKDTIAQQEQDKLLNAVAEVLPANADPDATEMVVRSEAGLEIPDYFVARNETGAAVGYALVCYGKGFSSVLEIMVGVDLNGVITGTSVLKQGETPGLGERINEIKSEGTLWSAIGDWISGVEKVEGPPPIPWFQQQYFGLAAPQLVLSMSVANADNNEVSAITGATITSKAFTDGVRDGVSEFLDRSDIPQ